MKFNEERDYIWYRTKTDITSFPLADMLLLANIHKDIIAEAIIKQNEDYFILPATTDLVLNQREYPFPADMLSQIKAVEVRFDATVATYVRAKELDLNDHNYTTDETTIVAHFDNDYPKYDIIRGSLWLFSGAIIAAASGLKLWFASYPADFTDMTSGNEMEADPTTTTFGFPKPFHELLGRTISIAYKNKHSLPLDKDEQPEQYKFDLEEALESIRNANLDRAVIGSLPENDGSQY